MRQLEGQPVEKFYSLSMRFEIFDGYIPVVSIISTPALLKPDNSSPPDWMVHFNQLIYQYILAIISLFPIMAWGLHQGKRLLF